MLRVLLMALLVSLPAGAALAQQPATPTPDGTEGLVDRTHSLVSESFTNFIYQIDDTLAGGEPVTESPASSGRVRLDFSKRSNDSTSLKGSIKVRAVLPRFEKRLRLLISTEEDLSADGENAPESNTDGLSFALRFIRNAKDNGFLNFDLGARWRDSKVQAFGRVTLSLDYFHGNKESEGSGTRFHSRITNGLYQYSSSGFENRFRYDLSKTLDERDSLLLRGSTDILWNDARHGALITETIGLYTDIDRRRALAFEVRASYSTRLNGDETDRFRGTEVRFRFRHNIYRDWFYYEFWPGVTWFADNNYRQAFQGLFRIETLIGKF